jgi:hypothetical protein
LSALINRDVLHQNLLLASGSVSLERREGPGELLEGTLRSEHGAKLTGGGDERKGRDQPHAIAYTSRATMQSAVEAQWKAMPVAGRSGL